MEESKMAKECSSCGVISEDSMKHCTECGTKLPSGTMQSERPIRRAGEFIFAGILMFGLWFWLSSKDDPADNAHPVSAGVRSPEAPRTKMAKAKHPSECLELGEHSGTFDDNYTTITGVLKNDCGRTFSYVQLTFTLMDGDGNVTGTAIAHINNLSDRDTWKFKAFGFARGERFRRAEITAF